MRACDGRSVLTADCGSCFALCCVVPAFAVSADFALDKEAGQPCPNLQADFGCGIHHELREEGFAGCAAYDCFGAGQQVAQVTFNGRDWRQAPQTAEQMFAVFPVMRQLHKMLWYLTEALALEPARVLHPELRALRQETQRLTHENADVLVGFDVVARRQQVGEVLRRVSELVRAGRPRRQEDLDSADLVGADLVGASLRGADLRGVSLRGAYLIGADLCEADLRSADLLGADLRGADLAGADLTDSIFLTRPQIAAARGDEATRLPPPLARPPHW